ncbi:MAG: efflux transporter outer membrane subunit [Betaproteobacteria bacterium]|nr:efflux transporter outer membrane subunit [Betaproteobacteria bacterium]
MKYFKFFHAPLVLAFVLAGCANMRGLDPEARLLEPDALASGKSLSGVKLSAAAWPAADWWRALDDTQLNAMIDEALQGNPDLALVDARLRQTMAQVLGADAARMPEVGFKASAPGAQIPTTALPPPYGGEYQTFKQLTFSFNYTFDLWGGQRAAWEAALGQQRAAEVDARAARLNLSADVARAYAQLAYAFAANEVARSDAARAKQSLDLTQQRLQAGLDSQAQLKQAEAALASAEQRLAQSEQLVDSGRTTLAMLLGKGPDRGLEIARPVPLKPMALALPEALPANLVGRRPDLVAARWRVESMRHGIDAAKAQFYPNVNLSVLAGTLAGRTSDILALGSRFAMVTPAISLPIFDGGRLRANLAGRDAEYDLAVAQYNKILVGALNEVKEQLSALQSLQVQEAAQRRAFAAEREAWDLAVLRYKNGVGSYLEVLTVQQALLAADLQLVTLHAQQIDASILLVRALGGGYHDDSGVSDAPATHASMQ